MRKFIICVFLFILLLLFIAPKYAYAFRFNVDPPRLELTINQGEKKNSYVVVSNTHPQEPIHIRAYVQDLVYLPDGSNDFLPPGTTPWSCANWISLKPEAFDLPANKEQVVKFQVKVPPEARGGYYGVIFFEVLTPPPERKDISAAAIAVRIGTIVLVNIAGTAEYKAELTKLSAEKDKEDISKFNLLCTVKNLGNILIRPAGTIQVLDSQEKEQVVMELNPAKGGIFPGTSRRFTLSLKEPLGEGHYTLRALLDYGGQTLLGAKSSFNVDSNR